MQEVKLFTKNKTSLKSDVNWYTEKNTFRLRYNQHNNKEVIKLVQSFSVGGKFTTDGKRSFVWWYAADFGNYNFFHNSVSRRYSYS